MYVCVIENLHFRKINTKIQFKVKLKCFAFSLSPCLFPSVSVPSEFLDIWDVDMMKRPDEINKKQHHTMLYNSDSLIVRRGQEFQIKITFNRPYKPTEDKFALEFVIGEPKILIF